MPRGLLLSRLQSSRNWVQTLALCPSYRRNSASSACNTCVRLMWWEKMIVLMSFPRRWCMKTSESCTYCWVCSLLWLYLPACACTHRERRLPYSDWGKSEGLFFGAAGEIARFALPLFSSSLTLFSSLSLSSSSIICLSFQKLSLYYLLLWA